MNNFHIDKKEQKPNNMRNNGKTTNQPKDARKIMDVNQNDQQKGSFQQTDDDIIRQITNENKQLLDGTSQNFRSMMESKIFQSSNYKDYVFDQWLSKMQEIMTDHRRKLKQQMKNEKKLNSINDPNHESQSSTSSHDIIEELINNCKQESTLPQQKSQESKNDMKQERNDSKHHSQEVLKVSKHNNTLSMNIDTNLSIQKSNIVKYSKNKNQLKNESKMPKPGKRQYIRRKNLNQVHQNNQALQGEASIRAKKKGNHPQSTDMHSQQLQLINNEKTQNHDHSSQNKQQSNIKPVIQHDELNNNQTDQSESRSIQSSQIQSPKHHNRAFEEEEPPVNLMVIQHNEVDDGPQNNILDPSSDFKQQSSLIRSCVMESDDKIEKDDQQSIQPIQSQETLKKRYLDIKVLDLDNSQIKKPLSAHLFFSQHQRKLLKQQNANLTTKQVQKKIRQIWQKMSKEERQKYQEMSEKDRDRYEKELKDLKQGKSPQDIGDGLVSQTMLRNQVLESNIANQQTDLFAKTNTEDISLEITEKEMEQEEDGRQIQPAVVLPDYSKPLITQKRKYTFRTRIPKKKPAGKNIQEINQNEQNLFDNQQSFISPDTKKKSKDNETSLSPFEKTPSNEQINQILHIGQNVNMLNQRDQQNMASLQTNVSTNNDDPNRVFPQYTTPIGSMANDSNLASQNIANTPQNEGQNTNYDYIDNFLNKPSGFPNVDNLTDLKINNSQFKQEINNGVESFLSKKLESFEQIEDSGSGRNFSLMQQSHNIACQGNQKPDNNLYVDAQFKPINLNLNGNYDDIGEQQYSKIPKNENSLLGYDKNFSQQKQTSQRVLSDCSTKNEIIIDTIQGINDNISLNDDIAFSNFRSLNDIDNIFSQYPENQQVLNKQNNIAQFKQLNTKSNQQYQILSNKSIQHIQDQKATDLMNCPSLSPDQTFNCQPDPKGSMGQYSRSPSNSNYNAQINQEQEKNTFKIPFTKSPMHVLYRKNQEQQGCKINQFRPSTTAPGYYVGKTREQVLPTGFIKGYNYYEKEESADKEITYNQILTSYQNEMINDSGHSANDAKDHKSKNKEIQNKGDTEVIENALDISQSPPQIPQNTNNRGSRPEPINIGVNQQVAHQKDMTYSIKEKRFEQLKQMSNNDAKDLTDIVQYDNFMRQFGSFGKNQQNRSNEKQQGREKQKKREHKMFQSKNIQNTQAPNNILNDVKSHEVQSTLHLMGNRSDQISLIQSENLEIQKNQNITAKNNTVTIQHPQIVSMDGYPTDQVVASGKPVYRASYCSQQAGKRSYENSSCQVNNRTQNQPDDDSLSIELTKEEMEEYEQYKKFKKFQEYDRRTKQIHKNKKQRMSNQ